jgi:glycosyltransferase involved in cell wall biosynthesis
MKVLWLTDYYDPTDAGKIPGGVEARCYYVAKYFPKNIFLKVISRPADQWRPAGVSAIPERLFFTFNLLLDGLTTDFDLVEGTNYSNYLIAWLLGVLKGKPVVFWYADVFIGQWIKNMGLIGVAGEAAERLTLMAPGVKYIAISEVTKAKLVRSGIKPEMVTVIGCGVDRQEISKIIKEKVTKKYDIVAVSRLVPYKRVDDLIQAVALLKKIFPKIKVAIVGEGPEKINLAKLTDRLGLGLNISFLGRIEKHEDVLRIIASGQVFCHPSVVEGYGIVVAEAMALKVPYVASDIEVIGEITNNGKGGALFRPKDVQNLAEKLTAVRSSPKRKLFSINSWRDVAVETEKQYENLLYH